MSTSEQRISKKTAGRYLRSAGQLTVAAGMALGGVMMAAPAYAQSGHNAAGLTATAHVQVVQQQAPHIQSLTGGVPIASVVIGQRHRHHGHKSHHRRHHHHARGNGTR